MTHGHDKCATHAKWQRQTQFKFAANTARRKVEPKTVGASNLVQTCSVGVQGATRTVTADIV